MCARISWPPPPWHEKKRGMQEYSSEGERTKRWVLLRVNLHHLQLPCQVRRDQVHPETRENTRVVQRAKRPRAAAADTIESDARARSVSAPSSSPPVTQSIANSTHTAQEPPSSGGQEGSNVQWRHQLAGSAPLGIHVHQHRDVLHANKIKADKVDPHQQTRNGEP